ncbi:homocysteine S-methyltransferase family protein [Nocardioides marmoraquaticus]
MTTRLADLARDGVLLLDGGMGTLLQERGLEDGAPGEQWNLERPDAVRDAHTAYAEAGSRVLTTNTFGGTRPRLELHGLGDRVEEVNEAAARIAREVADAHDALVAGDLGPTGELLEPLGAMTPAEAQAHFAEQLRGLVAGGVDLVLVETMSDLAEVGAAVAAAGEVAPDLPVVVTLSFDTNLRTMMGVTPAAAVAKAAELGVDAVGANCGRGPAEMEQIAAGLAEARPEGLLLVAQSNAGLPQLVGDRFEYDASPADLARHAVALRDLGVDLVGGCCGSTPAHLAAMREALAG